MRVDSGFGLEKPRIVESSILITLLPFAIELLRIESLSNLMRAIKVIQEVFLITSYFKIKQKNTLSFFKWISYII